MIAIDRRPILVFCAAVLGLFGLAGLAPAQFIWNNPNGGNWSIGPNWVGGLPPTPGPTTTLTFGSPLTVAATYIATNDIGTAPFDLNALTFTGAAGTLVTISGLDSTANGLNFTGTSPTITMGAGDAKITSATTLAATTTVGGATGTLTFTNTVTAPAAGVTLAKSSAGPLVLAAGGSFDTLSVQAGTASATGGTLALTAPTDATNATSGLQIGSAAGQTGTFTASGGATVKVTENVYVGDAVGSTGTLTVTGPGTVLSNTIGGASGRMGIGNSGTGTLNVTNGGVVNAVRLFTARNAGAAAGTVLVDGTGSVLHVTVQASFGSAGLGTTTIQNGGAVVADSSLNLGNTATGSGTFTATGAGTSVTVGVAGTTAASLTVGSAGPGSMFVQNGATLTANASATTGARVTIANGAGVTAGLTVDAATLTINSAGTTSTTLLAQTVIGFSANTNGTLTIQNGGVVNQSGRTFVALTGPSQGTITVTGAGSRLNNANLLSLSGGNGVAGGTAIMNVMAGGTATVGGTTLMGQTLGTTSTITVDSATFNANGQTQLNNGTPTINVQNGGTYTAVGSVFVGTFAGTTATVNVTGAGSAFATTGTVPIFLGGQGFDPGTPGGTAVLNANTGGTITAGGLLVLFGGGTANVNTGGTLNAGALANGVTGTSVGTVVTQATGVLNINGSVTGTYSGDISGGGSVTRSGTGTQILAGTVTYTGPTAVTGGVLRINGTLSAATNAVVVSGGEFGGTGTVNRPVTINAGGAIGPGASIGTLTFGAASPLTWQPAGQYLFEHQADPALFNAGAGGTPAPGTDNDTIVSGSPLNLSGLGTGPGQQFVLNLIPVTPLPAAPAATPVLYTLGTFSGVTLPTGVTGPDITPLFNFTGLFGSPPQVTTNGTGVFLNFAPVPEPAHVLLLCAAAAGVARWRRRGLSFRAGSVSAGV